MPPCRAQGCPGGQLVCEAGHGAERGPSGGPCPLETFPWRLASGRLPGPMSGDLDAPSVLEGPWVTSQLSHSASRARQRQMNAHFRARSGVREGNAIRFPLETASVHSLLEEGLRYLLPLAHAPAVGQECPRGILGWTSGKGPQAFGSVGSGRLTHEQFCSGAESPSSAQSGKRAALPNEEV